MGHGPGAHRLEPSAIRMVSPERERHRALLPAGGCGFETPRKLQGDGKCYKTHQLRQGMPACPHVRSPAACRTGTSRAHGNRAPRLKCFTLSRDMKGTKPLPARS